MFIKAFRHLDRLEQPERFAAWLKAVTANECNMWRRGNRRSLSLEEAEALPEVTASAVDGWRRREWEAEIRRTVEALPERSRMVVTLHYLSGLSHREIGHFLGLTANAVSQCLHRARRQLKALLLAELEEEYAMNKLPEDFAQEVLRRITLYPIAEGQFNMLGGDGDVRGLMLGAGERQPAESVVTLWMRQPDLDAITRMLTLWIGDEYAEEAQHAGKLKERTLASMRQILQALGAEITQVVLHLSGTAHCRAAVEFRQGTTEVTLDMRPSDALGLAVLVKAPIYAEEPVVQQGNVGEDEVMAPDRHVDITKLNSENHITHQLISLANKAWEIGLSLEEQVDTVRYHVDQSEGTVRMWLEAMPGRQVTFPLCEYAAGCQRLVDLARNRTVAYVLRDGNTYKSCYSLLDEDVRERIVLDEWAPVAVGQPEG